MPAAFTRLGGEARWYAPRFRIECSLEYTWWFADAYGPIMGEVEVRALEPELTLATRSWDDEFADVLATWPTALEGTTPDELSNLVALFPRATRKLLGSARGAGPRRAGCVAE